MQLCVYISSASHRSRIDLDDCAAFCAHAGPRAKSINGACQVQYSIKASALLCARQPAKFCCLAAVCVHDSSDVCVSLHLTLLKGWVLGVTECTQACCCCTLT
jgi:hypothetical protein